MNHNKTGKFIASLRKEKKLTQSELASLLQITDKAISRWETGEGLPDVSLLPKLANLFDVTIEEILEGTRKKELKLENDETLGRKERILFNHISFLSILIICMGFLLTLFLIYITEELLISTFFYIVILFASLILYIFKRVKFLLECSYHDVDKQTIFSNTRNLYFTIIITFSMLLPFYVITNKFYIGDYIIIERLIPIVVYVIYAVLFGLGGIILSFLFHLIHKNSVYGQFIDDDISIKIWLLIESICFYILILFMLRLDDFNLYVYLIVNLIILLISSIVFISMKRISYLNFLFYILVFIEGFFVIILSSNGGEGSALLISTAFLMLYIGYSIYLMRKASNDEKIIITYNLKNIFLITLVFLLITIYSVGSETLYDKFKIILIGEATTWFLINLGLNIVMNKKSNLPVQSINDKRYC